MKLKISVILILFFFALTVRAVEIALLPDWDFKPSFWERAWNKIPYCKWRLPCYWQKQFGVTITTIAASDTFKNSRTTINDDLSNLNSGKIENATTSVASITTLSNLSTVGTITSGTWNGSAVGVAYGGTGTTSPSQYLVMLGNGSGGLTAASSTGSSGQTLISNGGNAYPSWQADTTDQTANYTWTGLHIFNSASTTVINLNSNNATTTNATTTTLSVSGATRLNNISYSFPSGDGASSTVLSTDGNGKLIWKAKPPEILMQDNIYYSVADPAASTTVKTYIMPAGTMDATTTLNVKANCMGSAAGDNAAHSCAVKIGTGSATSTIGSLGQANIATGAGTRFDISVINNNAQNSQRVFALVHYNGSSPFPEPKIFTQGINLTVDTAAQLYIAFEVQTVSVGSNLGFQGITITKTR